MHDDDDDANFEDDECLTSDDRVNCPQCGAAVYLELNDECCPQCGHWFLEDDRDQMRKQAGGGLPLIYKLAVVLLLAVFLLPVLLLLL
jgi:hypothetical protein